MKNRQRMWQSSKLRPYWMWQQDTKTLKKKLPVNCLHIQRKQDIDSQEMQIDWKRHRQSHPYTQALAEMKVTKQIKHKKTSTINDTWKTRSDLTAAVQQERQNSVEEKQLLGKFRSYNLLEKLNFQTAGTMPGTVKLALWSPCLPPF